MPATSEDQVIQEGTQLLSNYKSTREEQLIFYLNTLNQAPHIIATSETYFNTYTLVIDAINKELAITKEPVL